METAAFTVLDWMLVGTYFVFVLYLSITSRRDDQSEEWFLLSGRKMSLAAFVATLVSTWYGGILGVGEYSYQFGISQWLLFGFPFYIFSALFAWFLAGKIRENVALTIPEAIERVYGSFPARISAVPIFILVSPAPYILMLGLLFQYLSGGEGNYIWYASGVAIFSVFYINYGGFSAVVRTDTLQLILMFCGFIILLIFCMLQYGSIDLLWQDLPEDYRSLSGGHDVQYILVWFFIALWTFVDPSFHQRAAAAESPRTARRGIYISILLWSVFDFLTVFCGMYAWGILGPEIEQPVMAYPYLANVVLPLGLKGLFFVALLATIMSTMDSYLFLSGQTLGRDLLSKLYPRIRSNQLTRFSVLIAAIFGIVLIMVYPSVIDLWYVIGSVMIPGLLIPVLGIYLPFFELKPSFILPLMFASIGISLVWLILGTIFHGAEYTYAFLGLEPFYPGLTVSLIIWIIARMNCKPSSSQHTSS